MVWWGEWGSNISRCFLGWVLVLNSRNYVYWVCCEGMKRCFMWSSVCFLVLLAEIVPMGCDVTDWWLCLMCWTMQHLHGDWMIDESLGIGLLKCWALFSPIRQYWLLAHLDHSYSTFYFIFSFPMTFHLLSALSFGFPGRFGNFLMELFSLRIISIVYIWCRGLVKNGYWFPCSFRRKIGKDFEYI